MKHKSGFLFLVSGLFALLSSVLVFNIDNNYINKAEASVGNYTTNANTYYQNIDSDLRGLDLLLELHDLMYETHKTYPSYADSGKNEYQRYTDPYPGMDGYIIDFYTHSPIKADWDGTTYNREHVWAQSLTGDTISGGDNDLYGESYGGSDMHHIRPTVSGLNSSRNNKKYGEVTSTDKWSGYKEGDLIAYHDSTTFEPNDKVKGDVARIVLYMYMHYNTRSNLGGSPATYTELGCNNTKPLIITNIMDASNNDDAFALLIEWNSLDPVDDIEKTRNEAASKYQGNRNPFIDHPEYIDYIWGDGQLTNPEPDPEPEPEPSNDSYFEKVLDNSQLTDGQYLIVDETKNVAFNSSLAEVDASNNYVTVNIIDDTIAYSETLNSITVTINKVNNNYSILCSNGEYIYSTSDNKNQLSTAKNQLTAINSINIMSNNNEANIISNNAHFRFNSDSNQMRFRYYMSTTYTGQKPVFLYKLIVVETDYLAQAVDYAKSFNEYLENVCNINGNTNLNDLNNAWLELKNSYNDLDVNAKNYFKDTSDNQDINNCLEKYDYIVNKYISLDDFMLRRNILNTNSLFNTPNISNNNLLIIICFVSIYSVSAIGIYFLVRKKAKNK